MEPDAFDVAGYGAHGSRRYRTHAKSETPPVVLTNAANKFVSPDLDTAPMRQTEWEKPM